MSRLTEIGFDRVSPRERANPAVHGAQSDEGLNGSVLFGSESGRGLRTDKGEQRDDSLKNLLLANLDLIQNQQELLLANERTIQTLRKENEMLKCRLDRIERRMSLVYQRGMQSFATSSTPASCGSPGLRSEGKPTRATNRKLNLEATDVCSEASEKIDEIQHGSDTEHERKRKSEDTQESVGSKTTQIARTSPRKSSGKVPSGKTRTSRRNETPRSTTSEAEVSTQKLSRLEELKEKMDRKHDRLQRRLRKNSDLLMTEMLYYVPPLHTTVDDEDEDDDVDTSCQDHIIVPSWRIKILSSLYVMEGTENLDDRVFLKRHQKSEAEEKRRKRWDIQRLKDLQLLRRQQLKEDASSSSRQDILTFLPQIDKALYIEVNDEIPVSAFGFPLPTLDSQEFQLPWYSANKDHTTKNKKLRKI